MTPEQYKRACELYERVSTLSPDERDTVLDRDCADPAVRGAIAGMLRSEPLAPTPEAFVASALGALSEHVDHSAEGPPPKIPGYRVLETLGKGGFGVVYEAMEESGLERKVAVKVLKPGMDSRMLLRRFEVERRTLSRLEHPGICRIYSAGTTTENTPYFVMELVRGETITGYCDNRLFDVHKRISLFLQVCDAVMYAHRRGVIHRDIKPSNLLVVGPAEQPRAVVIDFGVARVIAAEREHLTLTRAGQAIGTAAYMSPEQARGDVVDTRTDVYALGSVLFELVTGIDPLSHLSSSSRASSHLSAPATGDRRALSPSSAIRTAGREIAERRGTTRAGLLRKVRGDLDWILLKALDQNPEHRYGSVESLVSDLRAYLSNQAVSAHPARVTYHIGKFTKRNLFGVCAAAVFFVTLSAATGGSIYLAGKTRRAQIDAEEAKEQAIQRAQVAEATTKLLTEDMIQQLVPWHSHDISGKASAEITVRDILDATARACQERYSDLPVTKAAVLHAIGTAYSNLGEYDRATKLLDEAFSLRMTHLGPSNKDTVATQFLLLHSALTRFDVDTADRASLDLLKNAEGAFGADSEKIGEIYVMLAECQYRTRNFDLAIESAREANRILGGRGEISADIRSELTLARATRAKFGNTQDVADMCRRAYTRAIENLPDTHPVRLGTIKEYSFVLQGLGRNDEALPLARVNYETYLRIGGPEHSMTLDAGQWYSEALRSVGENEQAESLLKETVDTMTRISGAKSVRTRIAMYSLVKLEMDLGHMDRAVRYLDLMIPEANEHARASYLVLRGVALTSLRNYTEAESDLLSAWESAGNNFDRRDVANGLLNLYKATGDAVKTEQWTREADKFKTLQERRASDG